MQRFAEKLISREQRKWADITADPLWYKNIGTEKKLFASSKTIPRSLISMMLSRSEVNLNGKAPTKYKPQHIIYLVFEGLLENDQVYLDNHESAKIDWDINRQPINTIVLHHSKSPIPMREGYLSAMELLRIYTNVYNTVSADDPDFDKIHNQPIYSGHFDKNSKQVFWPYHWMIRPDGEASRLLPDNATGWHAGNLAVNNESVGVCFDADLTHESPNEAMLKSAADIISTHYSYLDINPSTVKGHNEIVANACPGDKFKPWRGKLLHMLNA